jgi:hypothetical protein
MKAKTTELKNGETNSCTFRVQLTPQGKNKSHARNLKIEQIGIQDLYRVTLDDLVLDRSWQSLITQEISLTIGGKETAWDRYKQLRAAMPNRSIGTELVTTRPVGIVDPMNPHYTHCNLMIVSRKQTTPGRCFYVTDVVYARADGNPVTADDIKALKNAPHQGQIHTVKGNIDDQYITVHSEVDSSD